MPVARIDRITRIEQYQMVLEQHLNSLTPTQYEALLERVLNTGQS